MCQDDTCKTNHGFGLWRFRQFRPTCRISFSMGHVGVSRKTPNIALWMTNTESSLLIYPNLLHFSDSCHFMSRDVLGKFGYYVQNFNATTNW